MPLHPDLAKLMPPGVGKTTLFYGGLAIEYNIMGDPNVTAFALAVARAERERCAAWLDHLPIEFVPFGNDLRALPDPDWATPA